MSMSVSPTPHVPFFIPGWCFSSICMVPKPLLVVFHLDCKPIGKLLPSTSVIKTVALFPLGEKQMRWSIASSKTSFEMVSIGEAVSLRRRILTYQVLAGSRRMVSNRSITHPSISVRITESCSSYICGIRRVN
jgi:hypothetical protein